MEEPSEEIEEQEYIPRKREKIKELSFNERVALIGGDHTKFNRRFNVESTSETNFQEALEKWMDQDQGADFEEFLFSIPRKELTTYAQLLHHSDKVFDAITQTLGKKGCKSIPALCEVLTAFARDLREEFFKHMWKSLEVLINVIDLGERDGDSMEAAFIALTTLVKLLAGKLCKQIKTAFTNFLPLFASSRPFARRFAAESFAYLIRKLNDLRPIVQFIVKQTLKTRHEYLSDGLAMLFHNVFIGMSGGFHSSAPDLLRNIVTAVVYNGPEADVDHDELIEYSVEILIQTVNYTSAYAKKSKSPDRLFFQQVITKLLGEAKNMEIATSLMRLVQSCLAEEAAMNVVAKRQKRKESAERKASQKRATDLPLDFAFADDLRASLNAVVALGDFALNETAVELFAKALTNVFNNDLSRLFAKNFALAVVEKSTDFYSVINLLLKTTELESFDLYLMPALGKVAQAVLEKENEDEVLVRQVWRFYAYLCSRRKPIEETLGRGTDRSNFFDLFPHQVSRKWILEKLNGNLKELREHDEELFLNLLIAWPWIFPSAEVSQASKAVLDFVKTEIGTKREEISSGQLVLVAFAGIFSVSRQLLLEIDLETLSSFVKVQQCRESSLLALELYFEVLGSSSDPELMDRVAQLLTPALMSPTDNARKTALRILSSFHVPLENPEVPSGEKMASKSTPTLFQVLSAAENCELTNFRERLLHLRKLRFGEHRRHMPEGREKQYQHLIVRVCVSQFFVQFTPLWKGLHEVLGTFARGMDIDLFWSTMNDCIDNITKKIDAKEDSVGSSILSGLSHVDEISRSDYVNARVQLFAFFAAIPEIAERRTRILAPVLLKLYREEFVPLTESRSKGRKVGKSAEREEEEEEEEEAEEHEEEEEQERTSKGGRSKQEFVDAVKALNSLLRVFSKFGDGRSVYMESKLREIYNELLQSSCESLQQSAFECILTYKDKLLTKYSKHIQQILNEKTIREGLINLKISEDEEDAVVLDEHRSSVIPVLLRVLNGKLNIRETKKGAVSRRNGILRTISGCRPNELSFFFDLHFEKLYKIIGRTATFAEIAEKCRADEFLSSFRPQMITRILRDVSEMLRKMARSIAVDEQRELLRVILACALLARQLISETKDHTAEHLKDLRMSVCDRVSEFFTAYPSRGWSEEEVLALRDYIFAGYLTDLPEASLVAQEKGPVLPVAPFSVVKVLVALAKFPSLFRFFLIKLQWNTVGQPKKDCFAFELLLAPLLWSGRFDLMLRSVRSALIGMVQLADEPLVQLPSSTSLQVEPLDVKLDVNLGTTIVLKKLEFLLDFLAREVENDVKTTQKPSTQNMNLLNRISDFVNDSEMSTRIAWPLFSCVEKRKCQEELLMQMLNTLGRIAQLVENPQEFIHRIAPLCSKINGRNAREALVGMAEGFAKSPKTGPRTRDILRLFGDLEAWDKSKVDEPNFDRRYNAYSKLAQIWLGDEPLDTSILSIFIHTHMHLISNTSDMSLRMAASNNLRSLISFAGRTLGKENANQNTKKNIVDGVFSPLFVQAMRSENEAVRDETLNCFAALVDAFPEHAILSQYVQLRSTDSDVDFLENMNHIQVHRRQRAMYRLVEGIKTNKISMDFPAMNKFLVPMVSPYLINTQSKTSALSDEALRVLNVVMSHAPWPKYVSCLEFWLSRVEKHSISSEISDRALVRVLVSVIDAFHFDLTTPDESMETEEADENAEPTVEQEPETEKPEKDHRLSILERVTQKILPRLTRCLNAQTEAVERNARTLQTKLFAEDFDIQRAPMALATVKMLKKLPEELQNQNLHGVVLKLCHLMISRSHSVRESARKIAIQVSEVLGSKYLPFIIREMQLVMTKGFQVHVVIFSVHTLIISQKENLKVGDLDTAVDAIMKLCVQDQFENASEEKELGSIKADVPEAKANRTPETLAQLGRVVSAAGIEHVLEPLRKVVDAKPSAKVITRVSDLLSKFVLGLKENDGISPSLLLNYIFQSLTGDIKKMQDVLDRSEESDVVKEHGRRPQSCLILPKAPKRIGAAEKTVVKSRVHVFAEFSAQLLAALLYAKRLDPTEPETISRLNPFVKIVLDCLKFKYDKLITHSLRALASMIQMQLPAIKNHLPDVSNTLFVLLAEYSSLGSVGGKASIQQLSQLLYKTFTKLISYAGSTWLTQENLSLLLAYAEVDVLDQQKQSTMFSLLKILVRKGVRHERLPEIMHHLSETAIRSPIQSIRTQCRETLIDFIGGASDELKKPEKHIEFFLDQLDYEYEDGRLSAAEMLKMLFTHLLPKTLTEVHMLCTVKMGAALVNDDSPKCATLVALGLRQLLTSVGVAQRQEVFEAICQWLEADDENARSVGLQVVMQLSAVEKDVFAARMAPFMDRVLNVVADDEFFDNNSESTLVLYAKCITTVLSHAGPEAVEHFDFDQLFDSLEQFVKCEDELSVRREGCRLLGQVLAMMSTSRISGERAKVVVDWMSRVIRHPVLDAATAEQASKSIVFVSKHLEDDSFAHLIAQIAQACRFEIKNQPKAILKRSYCFKLSLALALSNEARSNTAINAFFPLFVREITGKSQKSSEELVTLTNEICEVIKKKIGEEDFGRRTAQAQQDTAKRAAERKRKIKELAVTAPEDAAELKRRRNRKKLEVRKRKLDVQKPYRIAKRRHQEKMKAQMDEED